MSYLQYFSPQPTASEIPDLFRNPFENNPHPLAISACNLLKDRLRSEYPIEESGKMFGVLVVSDQLGKVGYLSSFSGMLNQNWQLPGFVPPIFNLKQQQIFLSQGAKTVNNLTVTIDALTGNPSFLQAKSAIADLELQQAMALDNLKKQHRQNRQQRKLQRKKLGNDLAGSQEEADLASLSQRDKGELGRLKFRSGKMIRQANEAIDQKYRDEINQLKAQRRELSQNLHERVFDSYLLENGKGERVAMRSLFEEKTPPGGAGDCAAPKLLQYAFKERLKPLALAEFWWGKPPTTGVRHHGCYYPPCRGKCHPILPFMLKGIEVETLDDASRREKLEPTVVFEDDHIVALNKPADLLSIPGKEEHHSVLSWLRNKYPKASGALLVHRLDMSTSGLLLAAKSALAHKKLQKQFLNRSVEKRYVALLSRVIEHKDKTIDLPLRVDLDDRPRQLVCYEHGKAARTQMQVISSNANSTRVHFFPVTGRTHQLRVHAAHSLGLAAPIVGDDLYGTRGERLFLHAEKINFNHPETGQRMEIKADSPF